MKTRYEYVIENGDAITHGAVMTTREDARHELREVKRCGFKEAKIIQRVYKLSEEKVVR